MWLSIKRRALACSARAWRQHPPTPIRSFGFFSFGNTQQQSNALVKSHSETKVVPFSPEDMYDVVADVDRYKEFLPFCVDSRVLRRPNDNVMEAVLRIGFHIFTESYTSRVIMKRPDKIVIKSIESPTFKCIESEWKFRPIAQEPYKCHVDFRVTFEVASFLHAHAIQLFFDDVAVTQLNAFINRARKLYASQPRAVRSPPSTDAKALLQTEASAQDFQELEKIFSQYANHSKLDFEGFTRACKELGSKYRDFKDISENAALAGAIFSSFETSAVAKDWLNLDEFTVGVYLMIKGTVHEKALNLFHAIDTSRDGKISRDELTTAMQRRIRTVKKIFPKLLQDQVELQMVHENLTHLPSSADEAMSKGLQAIEQLMQDIEKDIPLAVNQIFLEADLDQDDFITEDEWLFAWQAHPEFVELMTIDGMKKVAQWASVVHPDDHEDQGLETRLTYVD